MGNPLPKMAGIGHSILREPQSNMWHYFSFGAIPINKCTFLPPLMGDFGGKPTSPDPAAMDFWDVGVWLLQSMGSNLLASFT